MKKRYIQIGFELFELVMDYDVEADLTEDQLLQLEDDYCWYQWGEK